MNEENSIIVSGFRISEDIVLLDYIQTSQQGKVSGIAEQGWITIDEIEEELQDLQEILVELVDKIKLTVRNPPKRIRQGRRMLEQVDELLPEDDGEDNGE